jgi:hypothetical protein
MLGIINLFADTVYEGASGNAPFLGMLGAGPVARSATSSITGNLHEPSVRAQQQFAHRAVRCRTIAKSTNPDPLVWPK